MTEVLVATRAGLRLVRGSVFIDASGDADLSHHAGFGYELAGDEAPAQTATTTFRMANVDMAARGTIDKAGLHALMAEAAADGYDLPRLEGSDHVTPVEGVTATIMTRLDQVRRDADGRVRNATDPDVLTELEIAGRRQALEYARFLVDRVPGYERASLVALGTRVGVRETRRVYGDYRVTAEDVLAARQFDDQIGLCGAPIEDHHGSGGDGTTWRYLPDGAAVGIPLRSLIVRDGANTLVAGRCFSATHDAHASIRSMAQCMAMGQAAGTVAAMAVGRGGDVRAVPVAEAVGRLRRDGAVLAVPDGERERAVSVVRTVLGDIDPAELGVTYAHEHLVIDGGAPVRMNPDFDLGDVERMAGEVAEAVALGLRAVIDAMPCDCGRNVVKLAELSRRSGIHIVAPTGLHHERYYGPDHWSVREPVAAIAERFTLDVTAGIDANDYAGPDVRRTAHRAGVIKIAGSQGGPSDRDRRIFEAAAATHRRDRGADPHPLRGRHRGARPGPGAGRPRRGAVARRR